MPDFLFELGTEELPPKSLLKLRDALADSVRQGVDDASLKYVGLKAYATPRRLAFVLEDLSPRQPDQHQDRRGPAVAAAFDKEGNPTKAATGFASSCGVAVSELQKIQTDKGEYLNFSREIPGRQCQELIPEIIAKALNGLPIERRMRWGSSRSEFVRPVQWLVMMYGEDIVEAELLDHSASNVTFGHRFMSEGEIMIRDANSYVESLAAGKVNVNFESRRKIIHEQLLAAAVGVEATVVIDPDLLDEVTALVEWPAVLLGKFDQRFLNVPEEALISAMKEHQRYFHVVDSQTGTLRPFFLTVSNIESTDPNSVIQGNERVIHPRLKDAEFFFNQDTRSSCQDRLDQLSSVVFQSQLGSYRDKAKRISELAGFIAGQLSVDVELAMRAGLLAKTDLVSEMVKEFTDLQGIMGGYYAISDGEPEEVATALRQQYWPRYAGDQLPSNEIASSVALADKIDTLVGLFGIGQPPTGSKDPFGLRRASLGIIRIIVENRLTLSLHQILEKAVSLYGDNDFDSDPVYRYLLDRLEPWYQEKGIRGDVISAAIHAGQQPDDLVDFDQRVTALNAFKAEDIADAVIAANKRVANILKHLDSASKAIDPNLFSEPQEQQLFDQMNQHRDQIMALAGEGNYQPLLQELATLRDPIDQYFDSVMVMAEDSAVKLNRLMMLQDLRVLFLQAADFSRLQ